MILIGIQVIKVMMRSLIANKAAPAKVSFRVGLALPNSALSFHLDRPC